MLRTLRPVFVAVLLVVFVGTQAQAFTLTGGLGTSPTRVSVLVEDAQVRLLVSYTQETLATVTRQTGALYAGWSNPVQVTGVDWSFGVAGFAVADRELASPHKTIASEQVVTPRVDFSVRVNPVTAIIGISSQGLDYTATLNLFGLREFSVFVGYSSWPNHRGPILGLSANW